MSLPALQRLTIGLLASFALFASMACGSDPKW